MTPETDKFYASFADGVACPSQAEWLYHMQDLERRLIAARDVLACINSTQDLPYTVLAAITEVLKETKPKP